MELLGSKLLLSQERGLSIQVVPLSRHQLNNAG